MVESDHVTWILASDWLLTQEGDSPAQKTGVNMLNRIEEIEIMETKVYTRLQKHIFNITLDSIKVLCLCIVYTQVCREQ